MFAELMKPPGRLLLQFGPLLLRSPRFPNTAKTKVVTTSPLRRRQIRLRPASLAISPTTQLSAQQLRVLAKTVEGRDTGPEPQNALLSR